MSEIVLMILLVGVGSHLRPLSPKSQPKQFAPIISARGLFEAAVTRVACDQFAERVVVKSCDHRFLANKI